MDNVPELERHCGSWVIVCRKDGQAIMETFDRSIAEAVRPDRYEVLTAYQWLCRLNSSIAKGA